MKIFFLIPALALMTLAANAQKTYTIEGVVTGDTDGKIVYLYSGIGPYFTEDAFVNSAVITDGRFEFHGTTEHPDVYTLRFFSRKPRSPMSDRNSVSNPFIPLFLSSGTIRIEAVFDSIPPGKLTSNGLNYDFSKTKVTGPADLTLFMEYARGKAETLAAYDFINRGYSNLYLSKDIPARVAFVEKSDAARLDVKDYALDFIGRNADNAVGLWAFSENLSRFTADEIDRLSELFTPEMKSQKPADRIFAEARAKGRTAVGAPFVDYSFVDVDGNPIRLSDHVGKGRYVLLEFWASWCGPCRIDIPHLKEVYELYHPEGFEIISISMDADEGKWKSAVAEEGMPWLQISDMKAFESDLLKIYDFNAIPSCVLVSPDGTIVNRNFRGPRLDHGLIELYGNRFGDNMFESE